MINCVKALEKSRSMMSVCFALAFLARSSMSMMRDGTLPTKFLTVKDSTEKPIKVALLGEDVCLNLFELMLYVPVNSNGHVGKLPPFYGTFTQH